MSAEAIATAGVGVALLAVLVPVVVLQNRRLKQHIDVVADAFRGCDTRPVAPNQRRAGTNPRDAKAQKSPREKAEYFAILSVGVGIMGVMIALLGMMAIILVVLIGIDNAVDDLAILVDRAGLNQEGDPSPP